MRSSVTPCSWAIRAVICATISLACWSISSNQYLALAVPFVLNNGMSCFAQFFRLYCLDPGQLLLKGVCSQLPGGGIPYVLLYCAAVILVCGLLWGRSVTRRVRYG